MLKSQKERIGTKLLKRFNTQSILERQRDRLANMTEEQVAAEFNSFTPENMLKLVRLSMPYTGSIDFKNDPEDVIKQYVFGKDGNQKAELTEETIEIILDRFPTFFDKKEVEEAEENVQKGEGVPMRKRIFSEFATESSKDSIVYIKSDYKKMKKVWDEKHKNELYE